MRQLHLYKKETLSIYWSIYLFVCPSIDWPSIVHLSIHSVVNIHQVESIGNKCQKMKKSIENETEKRDTKGRRDRNLRPVRWL